MIIRDKELPVKTNVLYCIFSPYGDVESIARFWKMGDVRARVKRCYRCLLLALRLSIYEGCCELDLYFASESVCGCKPYIPRYKLDYKPPKTPLIPW